MRISQAQGTKNDQFRRSLAITLACDSPDYSGVSEGRKEQELRVSFKRACRSWSRVEKDKKNPIK